MKSAARLVLNHSTHIPGLIPALEHLCSLLPSGRVTPGRIAKCRPAREQRLPAISGNLKPAWWQLQADSSCWLQRAGCLRSE